LFLPRGNPQYYVYPGSKLKIECEDPVQKEVDKIIQQSSDVVRVTMNMIVPRSQDNLRDPAWKALAKLTLQPAELPKFDSTTASAGKALPQDPFQKAVEKLNRSPIKIDANGSQTSVVSKSEEPVQEPLDHQKIEPGVSDGRLKVTIRDPISAKPIVLPKPKSACNIAKRTIRAPTWIRNIEKPELPIVADWLNNTPPSTIYPLVPSLPYIPYFTNSPQWDCPIPPIYPTEAGYHGGRPYGGMDEATSVPLQPDWADSRFIELVDFLGRYPMTGTASTIPVFPPGLQAPQDPMTGPITVPPFHVGYGVAQNPPIVTITSPPVSAGAHLPRAGRRRANRPHAAAIQQKLEYMLYQKKEKEALAKKKEFLTPPMTSISDKVDWQLLTRRNRDAFSFQDSKDAKDLKSNAGYTEMLNIKTRSKSEDVLDSTSLLTEMQPGRRKLSGSFRL
jgi:hypothetical protein